MVQVDEIAKGIYRICTFEAESGLNFNQFLIDDEEPALLPLNHAVFVAAEVEIRT